MEIKQALQAVHDEICAIELDIQQKEEPLITSPGSVPYVLKDQAQ